MESIGRLVLLAACLGGAQACASPAVSAAPLQLIIGFSEPVDGAAPATLARLAAASGAEFAYVSSVSPRSHAYRLRCPASDPGCACALAALKAQPSIEYLSPDPLKDSR